MSLRTNFFPIGGGEPYKIDQVVFETGEPGDYTFDLKAKGYYELVVIGAGGGGVGIGSNGTGYTSCTGAASGGFKGIIYIPNGIVKISIGKGGNKDGGGDSNKTGGPGTATKLLINDNNVITCNGGTGGHAWWRGNWELGVGGTVVASDYVIETILSVTGSRGSGGGDTLHYCEPPLSDYPSYGFGGWAQGTGSGYYWQASDGAPGYISIKFVGF